jgi:hypothetical protein
MVPQHLKNYAIQWTEVNLQWTEVDLQWTRADLQWTVFPCRRGWPGSWPRWPPPPRGRGRRTPQDSPCCRWLLNQKSVENKVCALAWRRVVWRCTKFDWGVSLAWWSRARTSAAPSTNPPSAYQFLKVAVAKNRFASLCPAWQDLGINILFVCAKMSGQIAEHMWEEVNWKGKFRITSEK